MTRLMPRVVLATVLVVAGCASSKPAAKVMVPAEANAWIGSIIPRLHRAGLRVAIPQAWGATSYGTPIALLRSPAVGTPVPVGTVETLRMAMMGGMATETLGRRVVPDVRGATAGGTRVRITRSSHVGPVELRARPC